MGVGKASAMVQVFGTLTPTNEAPGFSLSQLCPEDAISFILSLSVTSYFQINKSISKTARKLGLCKVFQVLIVLLIPIFKTFSGTCPPATGKTCSAVKFWPEADAYHLWSKPKQRWSSTSPATAVHAASHHSQWMIGQNIMFLGLNPPPSPLRVPLPDFWNATCAQCQVVNFLNWTLNYSHVFKELIKTTENIWFF